MSSSDEPSLIDATDQEVVGVDRDMEEEDREAASGMARAGMWAVPVAMVHLALIYAVASSAFNFRLPGYLHADHVLAWLWVNGAAIGLAAWFWKKGRVPVAAGKWLHGRRARWLILTWLGASLAWFLLPAVLHDIWRMLFNG